MRLVSWSGVPEAKALVVPNAVDLAAFTPGPKRPDLVARYNLVGRSVLMGRPSSFAVDAQIG